MKNRVDIRFGSFYIGKMPHSEVCVHMRVAGKEMGFTLTGERGVQLFERKSYGISPATNHEIVKWEMFSFPILRGEAGIMEDEDGPYAYDTRLVSSRPPEVFCMELKR